MGNNVMHLQHLKMLFHWSARCFLWPHRMWKMCTMHVLFWFFSKLQRFNLKCIQMNPTEHITMCLDLPTGVVWIKPCPGLSRFLTTSGLLSSPSSWSASVLWFWWDRNSLHAHCDAFIKAYKFPVCPAGGVSGGECCAFLLQCPQPHTCPI